MDIINTELIQQIERLPDESNKIFDERIKFIEKVYSNTNDLKESIRLSKIYMNYKFKDCKYSPDVFFKIKPYLN
jgi:TATA-box binding protein (TBP) (component of TFIID and TFIIIB)|tara:strand:+ start:126 stop:347 length:222 start_codon:yes stop_codon:yes gene_type:complete